MRLVGSLLVALFLAGCGAATQQTNVPASSGEGETVKPPKGYVASDVKPPQIVLLSETGRQTAVQRSYCVTGDEQGICVDMASPLVPKAVTVVQPGDQVTIAMPEATLKTDSVATVRPLGCADRTARTIELPPSGELDWRVDLDSGAYQIDVFARFEAHDGRSGDLSGTLGLLVGGGPKSNDYRGVLAVKPAMHVCAFTD
jgi:hypothetical protein